jgi:hypothetical protein
MQQNPIAAPDTTNLLQVARQGIGLMYQFPVADVAPIKN